MTKKNFCAYLVCLGSFLVTDRFLVNAEMVYISPGHKALTHSNMEFPLISGNELVPEIPNNNPEIIVDDIGSNPQDEITMRPPEVDCGEEVDGMKYQNGTITSPGFPDNYPAFLNCKYIIRAMPGKKILARFSEFDITDSTECSSDYVTINTGESSARFCGKSPPSIIESDNEVLEIQFHTNQGDSCRGFSLDYTVVTKQVSCNQRTSDVQFEFRSPNYPDPLVNKSMQCDLTISHDCETPICQLRLDMLDFRLGPPNQGDCNEDQFIIRANEPLPVLCGNNSKQHLYIDVRGRKETNLNILSMPVMPKPVGVHNQTDSDRIIIEWLYEVDPDRAWNILVTQIPCSCSDTALNVEPAPTGCLQYHTDTSGVISSFNYDGTVRNYEPCWNGTEEACGGAVSTGHLNNMDYSICIKSQTGYCGVAYKQVDSESFQLTGLQEENIPNPVYGETECTDDYVYIPRGNHPQDFNRKYPVERYCGQVMGNRLAAPVITYSKPFMLRMRTDGSEPHGGVAINNKGFQLSYTQIPCSVEAESMLVFT